MPNTLHESGLPSDPDEHHPFKVSAQAPHHLQPSLFVLECIAMSHPSKPETRLAHQGRPAIQPATPVNPPLVRASTQLYPDYASLSADRGQRRSYGRYGTSGVLALEDSLCALEDASMCRLVPSGLSAITLSLMALLKPGDHLLMTDSAYDPARRFCENQLRAWGVEISFYDPASADIRPLLQPNTRVLFIESPGSLTFEMQDVPALAAAAHAQNVWVVADNTWATPLGWKPFEHGVDVSLHAITKYIGGHSDVLMGAILCNTATAPLIEKLWHELGMAVSPDDTALALRGLRSLGARLRQHADSALQVADWLLTQPQVAALLYPPHPDSAGHLLWKRDFNTGYAAGLLAVELENVSWRETVAIADRCQLFGKGYSWGGYESLILPISLKGIRSVTAPRWENRVLLRLHVGLEAVTDLLEDLGRAFKG